MSAAGPLASIKSFMSDHNAVIMMVVAGVLGLGFIFLRRNYAYALVIVWALLWKWRQKGRIRAFFRGG